MNSTISELRNSLDGPSDAYREKQLHAVPDAPSVDRMNFILDRCKGQVVLDIGASGPMHEAIVEVAKRCYGIDRPGIEGQDIFGIDLDYYFSGLPYLPGLEIVVCGEVIEHLSNPGWFLDRLRAAYICPVIITVPNAFADGGRPLLDRHDIENCNSDHVAWYSHRTIKTLLNRHGYAIKEFYWYGGRPKFSEGLIAVALPEELCTSMIQPVDQICVSMLQPSELSMLEDAYEKAGRPNG